MKGRGKIRLALGVGVVLLALSGCVGKQWGTQGVPFFPLTEDTRASLEEFVKLEEYLSGKIGVWDLAQVEDYITSNSKIIREKNQYPAPLPERQAMVNGKQRLVSRVWRFTTIDRRTLSLPAYGRQSGKRVGFVLQADEQGGKVPRIQTSFTYLPDQERDFSTKPIVTGAVAVGATLLLLAP